MPAPSKTAGTSVLALQSVASNTVVISSDVAVTTTMAATIFAHFGRRAETALTTSAKIRVEASSKGSGAGHWYPLAVFETLIAAAASEAATGTNNAGQPTITVASTTGFAVGDIVYIDNTTIGNSEWHRVKSIVTNTSVTFEDNLVNAQSTPAATLFTKGEMYAAQLDLTAITRLRVVFDGSGTGQATAIEVDLVTGDSIA